MQKVSVIKISDHEYRFTGEINIHKETIKYVVVDGEMYSKSSIEPCRIDLDESFEQKKQKWHRIELVEFEIFGFKPIVHDYPLRYGSIATEFYYELPRDGLYGNNNNSTNERVRAAHIAFNMLNFPDHFKFRNGNMDGCRPSVEEFIDRKKLYFLVHLFRYGFNNHCWMYVDLETFLGLDFSKASLETIYANEHIIPEVGINRKLSEDEKIKAVDRLILLLSERMMGRSNKEFKKQIKLIERINKKRQNEYQKQQRPVRASLRTDGKTGSEKNKR